MESRLQVIMIDIDSQSIKRRNTRDTETLSEEQSVQNIQLDRVAHQFKNNSSRPNIQSYCRICLQAQEEENRLIQSCNCRDLIHQKCLLEWIEHRSQVMETSQNFTCEICKNQYTVKIQSFLSFTCEIFKQKYDNYRKQFIKSIIQFTLCFALFVLTAILLGNIYVSSIFCSQIEEFLKLPSSTVFALIIMIVLFLGVFSIGLLYKLVVDYCYGISYRLRQQRQDLS